MNDFQDFDDSDGDYAPVDGNDFDPEGSLRYGYPPNNVDWYARRSVASNPQPPTANPYLRWGDTQRIQFTALQTTQTREFQRITLPRPTVCTLRLHAEATPVPGGPAAVNDFAFEFVIGVGSSAAKTRRKYLAQPQVPTPTQANGTPLDRSWREPVEALYGRIEASGSFCVITVTIWLSPFALEQL